MSYDTTIWNYLKGRGFTDFAAAGIMGNLYAESGLNPENLQNNFEATLGMTDHQYTMAVDNYTYDNFVKDAAGYGLAQWTFWSRKQGLFNLARNWGKSVGDLEVQLEFLVSELKEFGLIDKLNSCQSVRESSNIMLFEFEKPYDTGTVVQNAQAKWSEDFYNKFHGQIVAAPVEDVPNTPAKNEEMYCVIALGKYATKAEAKNYMKVLQGNGFSCLLTTVECSG